VTEFFANYREPWSDNIPLEEDNDIFHRVDFLRLEGSEATVAGTQITLDGTPDFQRIWPARDTIFLQADTERNPGRTYLIIEVDAANSRVTLEAAPNLNGAAATAWRINGRPTLVLIDPFGPRIQGDEATIMANRSNRIRLDINQANFERINVNGFESIFFYNETQSNRIPSRSYRIVSKGSAGNDRWVELNETPVFQGVFQHGQSRQALVESYHRLALTTITLVLTVEIVRLVLILVA